MGDYISELNKEQLEAVNTINGPLLVIAGAGTGKTKTMICRAAHMIESGIPSSCILMLTFTNKAADEMKKRLGEISDERAEKITACTFHSFCALMLRFYGNRIGMDNHFTIIPPSDETDVVDIVKTEQGIRQYEVRGFPPSAKIVSIISKSANLGKSIEDVVLKSFSTYYPYIKHIEKIAAGVKAFMAKNNLVNYDDILLNTVRLLETCGDVTARIAAGYHYIMVDEYQDTNTPQETILRCLFKHTKNIAVVGDDMQALYGFRGATPKNILTFAERYPGTKTVFLTKNYRSNQEILDLANDVVEEYSTGYMKCLSATHQAGYLPELFRPSDEFEEAKQIAEEIVALKEKCGHYGETCVLFRASSESLLLEAELASRGIPFVKYGGPKFFDQKHIKDILAYLRILMNPKDEVSWFRILKVPYGIGDVYAREISSECREIGAEALLAPKLKKRMYWDELVILHNEMATYNRLTLTETMDRLIDFYIESKKRYVSKMRVEESRKTEESEKLDEHVRDDLEVLRNLSRSFERISDFLDALLLDKTSVTQDSGTEDELVLSTVHSAKGLEFKNVIVMGCVEGLFPLTFFSSIDEDELRCFYVALTRAKDHLSMYAPSFVQKYNRSFYGEISHFLSGSKNLYKAS